jgi:hypothetical protein
VKFEPAITVFERAKTVHALDRAATVFGPITITIIKIATATIIMWTTVINIIGIINSNFSQY